MSFIHYHLANEKETRMARVLFRDRGPAPAVARQLAAKHHGQVTSVLPTGQPYWWRVKIECRPRAGGRRIEVKEFEFKLLPANAKQLGL